MASAEEPPPERDVKDFRYQRLCRFQISEGTSPVEEKSPQLIAASSKYGIFFVGTNKGFKVIKTSELSKIDNDHPKDRTKVIIKDYPCQASVELPTPPSFLALSSDDLNLACVVESADLSQVYIYDVRSFVSQGNQAKPFLKIRLSCGLADLAWNPEQPSMLVCVMEDGSIQIFEVADNLTIKASLPAHAKATCVCWSPKGKQLVVGQDDGMLAQYDQSLVRRKDWVCPDILQGQHRVVGIEWLSTFSFLVAYLAEDGQPGDQPNVILITGAKDTAPKYTPFEDPCFGGGEERRKKIKFSYIPNWELIAVTSSTAIEIAVLGKHFDNKNDIERWNLDDAARAEIPLTADHSEAYSMGVAIDYSSQLPIPLSDDRTLPPSPILLVLSSDGYLIPYYMIYSHPEAPSLTVPPAVLPAESARQSSATASVPSVTQAVQSTGSTGPSFQFVSSKPAATTPASGTAAATGFTFGGGTMGTSLAGASTPKPSLFGTPAGGTSLAGASTPNPSLFGTPAANTPIFGTKPVSSNITSTIGTPQTSKSDSAAGSGFNLASKPAINTTSTAPISFNFGKTSAVTVPTTTTSSSTPGNSVLSSLLKTPEKSSTVSTQGQTSFPFGAPSMPNASGFNFGAGLGMSAPQPTGQPTVAKPEQSKPVFTVKQSQSQPGMPVAKEEFKPAIQQQIPAPQPALAVAKKEQPSIPAPQQSSQQDDVNGGNLDSTYTHSIREEMAHFEEELRRFRSKALSNRVTVGDVKEMEKIKKATEDIGQFSDNVKTLIKEQTKEVEDIKSLELDSFSMIEECRIREQRNTDPKYIHLLRSKKLDPSNHERLRSLQQKYQILDRGLRDCDTVLNNQWEEYQNKNKKLTRICTPTTDLIYRTIKSNKNLILHQKLELDDLEGLLKQLRIYNKTSTWQDTLSESRSEELSSLADSLLESKTTSLSTSRTAEPASPQKMARLKEHLSRRSVPRIKSTRPENLSMSRIVSMERQAAANRSPEKVMPVKTEQTMSNGFKVPQQSGQPFMAPTSQMTRPSLQQQAMSLTGTSIRFQTGGIQGRPQLVTTQQMSNFGQPGMSGFGSSLQSSGKTSFGSQPGIASGYGAGGFNAVKPTFGVMTTNETKPAPALSSGFEDITPPSSTGYEEDEEDEDETETETETNDEDYGEGFGSQYNMPSNEDDTSESEPDSLGAGKNITSTPLSSVRPDVTKTGSALPSRNLFGSSKPPDAGTMASGKPFPVGISSKESVGFAFGNSTNAAGGAIPKTSNGFNFSANSSTTQSAANVPPSSSFKFTPGNTSSPTFKFGQTGASSFGTGQSTTSGFNFSSKSTGTGQKPADVSSKTEDNSSGNFRVPPADGETETSRLAKDVAKSTAQLTIGGTAVKTASDGDNNSVSLSATSSASQNLIAGRPAIISSEETEQEEGETTPKGRTESEEEETTEPAEPAVSGVIFGQTTTNSSAARSLFGPTSSGTSTPLFGQSAFGSSTGSGLFGQSSKSGTGLFGQNSTSSSKSTGIFGTDVETTSEEQATPVSTTGSGLFGQPKTSTAVTASEQTKSETSAPSTTGGQTSTFGGGLFGKSSELSPASSIFGQTSSTGIFGQKPLSSTGGLFGQSTTSANASASFGQSTTASATASAPFGQSTTTSTSASTAFGQSSTSVSAPSESSSQSSSSGTTSTSENLFLQKPSASSGLFGQAASPGLFGQSSPASSSSGLFGKTTASSSSGLFGQTTASSSSGLFGQTTASSSSGLFGQTTSASSSSGLFGQTKSATSSSGLFGQTTTAPSSSGLFGQTTSTTSSNGLFGQPAASGLFGQTATSSSGLFGQTTLTSSSSGPFGQKPASSGSGLFGQPVSSSGSTGLFGQSLSKPSSGLFGQPASGSSPFGGSTGTSSGGGLFGQTSAGFGQSPASSASAFGQSQTSSAPAFGQTAFGQTSFGQASCSPFGATTTTSSGGGIFGGSMFGGLGGQPSTERANTNVFGTTVFGSSSATSSAGSLFGSQGSTTFGAKTSGAFGGGSFSGGGGTVAASGFAVSSQQQTSPAGFGAPPAFGSSPAFGGGAAFGSKPTFGTSPTFGGGSAFGSQPTFGNPVGGGFGSPQPTQSAGGFSGFGGTGSSPTFEALAGSSNVPTFGSLSQGGGFGGSPGFGGGTQSSGFGGGGFGSTQQQGFGSTPPNNPAFSGYRS